jgi:UDP-glucuronate 4-epimerase
LRQAVGFAPNTPLETGLRRFAQWYRDYYKV